MITYRYLSDGTKVSAEAVLESEIDEGDGFTPATQGIICTMDTELYDSEHDNRYRYAGKEEQRFGQQIDLALLDFGARSYDPFTARWTSVDPLANKYLGLSPYNYCGGNPVMYFDPDGKDNYIFNSGRYIKTIPNNGPHIIIDTNVKGESISITFADIKNDPSSINRNTSLIYVSDKNIEDALNKAGVNIKENQGMVKGSMYLLKNSNANSLEGGCLDFTGSGEYQISTENTLYVTNTKKDGMTAHNAYNYGNFLWGAAASRLRVPGWFARLGAHINNFFNDCNSKWCLDSKDDQKSIQIGINWNNEKH